MNLDDFISKAVSDVRNAKTTGKKGRKARKNIRKGQAELDEIKRQIRETALACEERAWKKTRLIVRRYEATCKYCHEQHQSCTVIYLEQKHAKLGTIQRRLDEIQLYSFPNLPREYELIEEGDFICGHCFTSYEHKPTFFKYTEPYPMLRKPLTKWEQEYKVFSENYDRNEIKKIWKKLLPKTLLLEYLI